LKLAASPEDLIGEESEEGVVASLLRGFTLEVKLNVWRKLADILTKLAENENFD